MLRTIKRKVVKHGQSINLGCFRVEFVKTNHSIVDASAWRFSHRRASLSTPATSRSTTLLYSASRLICSGLRSLERRAFWH